MTALPCVADRYSVLQRVAVCCSDCSTMHSSALQRVAMTTLLCVAVCCSVSQRVAVTALTSRALSKVLTLSRTHEDPTLRAAIATFWEMIGQLVTRVSCALSITCKFQKKNEIKKETL